MVDFPLYNFDMTPHLANKDGLPNNPMLLGGVGWSPWKRPRKISTTNDNSYDLYAVCYHHGNDLETGHYTAACKNPYDQQWYKFDDTRVSLIPNDDVTTELINNSAYILFYQRRHGNFVGCSSNSSSAASTSSIGSNSDHWAARMPKFTYQPKKDSIDKKTQNAVKQVESIKNDDEKPSTTEEIELSNFNETVHLRTSTSSLQDNRSDCKENDSSPTDEKNLRNSISLSDNLRISTNNVGPADASDIKLEVEPEKLINKDSLYTMGESRRNTLSEYRNSNDEFNGTQFNNETHRNSISLTVDPYLRHKDIHVNPKMTSSKTSDKSNFNATLDLLKSNENNAKNYSFSKFAKREVAAVRTSVYENSILEPPPTIGWLRGDKGYSTLRPRQCFEDVDAQKDHHSDDEAPLARSNWVCIIF